ncbi:glutathione S-transferase [Hyphomicrobiales bacterium]|nr:glutathione S-transferase [Hyphomicrobiales bacterium]
MIKVHHLNNSRSQRVLWLLEELEVPYEIISYKRDLETNLAPEILKEVHPLGKSPVITDNGNVIIESAAITTYIIDQYGPTDFGPNSNDHDYYKYLELMHYAEGSAMLPLLLLLYSSSLGENAEPLMDRISSEIHLHIGYLSKCLGDDEFFFRNKFSGLDTMLSFVLEASKISDSLKNYPNLVHALDRYQSRPAYKKALDKGGEYILGS